MNNLGIVSIIVNNLGFVFLSQNKLQNLGLSLSLSLIFFNVLDIKQTS